MEIDAIEKLIEADESVRKEIQEVHDKRNQLRQAVENEKKKMSDDAWKTVNEKVDQTKKELDEKIRQDDQKNQVYYEAASKDLQNQYDMNKDSWRKEIFQRVITLEDVE